MDLSRHRNTALLVIMSLVTALVTLDTTITGVILPSIGRSLQASFGQLEWVISGYMLPFASLLLPAGAWADHIGRKRATLIGLVIFAVSSLLCGLAPSAGWLVAARVVQGIGAALLPSASIAIIGHTFRGSARMRAFALLGSIIGIATLAGPIIGGLLASWVGWKWAFLVNPPLCVALVIAILYLAEESKDPASARFDLAGVVTFASALALLTSALIDANSVGLTQWTVLVRVLAAALFFFVFVQVERRQTSPMLDLALLGRPAFQGAVVSMLGYASTAQILIFYLPMYFQGTYHVSALTSGEWLAPFALPLFLAPRWAAALAQRYSSSALLTAGLALTGLGNSVMAAVAQSGSYPVFALGMVFAGSGAGILNGETAKAFFAAIPPERSGIASGLGTTTRFSGLLIAVAIIGAILSHTNFTVVFVVQATFATIGAITTHRLLRGQQTPPSSVAGVPVTD